MNEKKQTLDIPDIDMNDAQPRRWGWWLLIIGFGGFFLWATLAPLDAGVSAAGSVVVSGNRKAVQPLAAGQINAILVRDGDEVTAGQVLVRFDDTQSKSQFSIAKGQWFASLANEARLVAERSGRSEPAFTPELLNEKTDQRVIAAMTLQGQLLSTRRQSISSELAAMKESIRGLELQTMGFEASRIAKDEQLRLLTEQLERQRELEKDGFFPRNRVSEQERNVASMAGAIAEDTGNVGRNRQSIAEVKERMTTRQREYQKEVETQLAETQRDSSSLKSRLEALQFELANTEIKSPANGLVMGLAVHTIGGVVAAGSPMMEIVPKDEALKIETQIPPHLIDKVKSGFDVDILFTALNQVSTPRISGIVTQVSADVLVDQKQSISYYKATVEVTADGVNKLKDNEIRAGMPVEVFIKTGERTALNYLLKPLLDRLNRALTEP